MKKINWGLNHLLVYEADGTPTGQEPSTTQPAPGAQEVTPETPVKVDELPVNVQSLIKSLRSEAANYRKAQKDAEATAAKAAEEKLASLQEWETLAKQRQERIATLEATVGQVEQLSEKVTRYEAILKANIDAQVKSIPSQFKPLFDKLDLSEQLQWLTDNAATLQRNDGPPPTPRANAAPTEAQVKERQEKTKSQLQKVF